MRDKWTISCIGFQNHLYICRAYKLNINTFANLWKKVRILFSINWKLVFLFRWSMGSSWTDYQMWWKMWPICFPEGKSFSSPLIMLNFPFRNPHRHDSTKRQDWHRQNKIKKMSKGEIISTWHALKSTIKFLFLCKWLSMLQEGSFSNIIKQRGIRAQQFLSRWPTVVSIWNHNSEIIWSVLNEANVHY